MAEPREIALNELRKAVERLSELNQMDPRPSDFQTRAIESASEISSLIDKAKAILENKKPDREFLVKRFSAADANLKEALATGNYSYHLVTMALVAGEAMVKNYYAPGFTVEKLGTEDS